MKKNICFLLILQACLSLSCSSDDDSSGSNEVAQKLIGTWGTYGGEEQFYAKFTFRNDSKVEYYATYTDDYEPIIEEVGDWEVAGNILTMVFPETVSLTYVQRVVFTNDNTVQFVQVEGSNEEAYRGTYYRAE